MLFWGEEGVAEPCPALPIPTSTPFPLGAVLPSISIHVVCVEFAPYAAGTGMHPLL